MKCKTHSPPYSAITYISGTRPLLDRYSTVTRPLHPYVMSSRYGFRRLGVTHTQVTPGCDPGDRQRPPGPCKVTGAPEGGRLSESPRDWLGCASVRPRHARMPSRRRQQHCAIRRLGGRLKRRAPLPDFSGGRSLLASPAARTHPHSLIPRPLALSPSQRWRSGGRQGTVVGTKESRAPSTRRRARYTRGSSCVAAFQSCAVAPVGYPYTLGAFAHSTFHKLPAYLQEYSYYSSTQDLELWHRHTASAQ